MEVRNLVDLVNTRYGDDTSTVVGPQVPWGSVNPSPNTEGGGAAGTDGFRFDQDIKGFAQLHVSGTGGWGAYGNLLLSPQIGLAVGNSAHSSPHSQDVSKPYYYKTHLNRYGITCEITPTHHAALYRFTYPASQESHILLDAGHTIPRDIIGNQNHGTRGGQINYNPSTNTITGWGKYFGSHVDATYTIYFAAKPSKAPTGYGTFLNSTINQGQTTQAWGANNDKYGTFLKFSTTANETIHFKIAVSFQSIQKAEQFLVDEIPAWNFDGTAANCANQWNQLLSTVLIDDPTITSNQLTQFYNNLYHTFLMPRNRTGDSPHWTTGDPYYDDQYCIWDTFRTLFPLQVLLKESFVRDNVKSFIKRHTDIDPFVSDTFIGGDNRPLQQAGDDVDCVIADAYAKGVSGVDWTAAYSILKYHADNMRLNDFGPNWTPAIPGDIGSSSYRVNNRGWRPYEDTQRFVVSDTLEYAYNDFCAALMAHGLGYTADFNQYLTRSGGWENLWHGTLSNEGFTGFIQPRYANGTWRYYDPNLDRRDWSPEQVLYEGTSWRYSYFTPHNAARMIALMGGPSTFVNRTVHYFESDKHESGNEPTFLVSRLFNYAGRPDLSAKYTREVMADFSLDPHGPLPGDDDSGAMGAWFCFSAMGFMPVAGSDVYLINGPKYRKFTIQMENGQNVVINGPDANQPTATYVQSASLNSAPLQQSWFRHGDIRNGATLDFTMGTSASTWAQSGTVPPSLTDIFSTATPQPPTGQDAVKIADWPTRVNSSGTVRLNLHYTVPSQRDLLVEIFDQNWNLRGTTRIENLNGSGNMVAAVSYSGITTGSAILVAKVINDGGTWQNLLHQDFTTGVTVNAAPAESVSITTHPGRANRSGPWTARLEYATTQQRDLLVEVFDQNWVFKGQQRIENLTGSGIVPATVSVSTINTASAFIVAKLITDGGTAANQIATHFVSGVTLNASASDAVTIIGTPDGVNSSGSALVWLEYTTSQQRDFLVEIFDQNWVWKGNTRIENRNGSGVAAAMVTYQNIATPNAIIVTKLIPDGGTWQNTLDEDSTSGIPVAP